MKAIVSCKQMDSGRFITVSVELNQAVIFLTQKMMLVCTYMIV